MQGLRTYDAMRHADLTLSAVWSHFLNMGGVIGQLEADAYLHGLMPLPLADRDCLAQAVNELLDDRAMAGSPSCCRAPYNGLGTGHACRIGRDRTDGGASGGQAPDGRPMVSGTAARPVPRPWQPRHAHRAWRREG